MTDTQHEAAERVSDERLQQIATKIISASINDQRYERPMGWDDARSIVSELLALRAHDAGQAGVVVKPLEWVKFSDGIYTAKASPLGVYSVHDGYITLKLNGRDLGRHGSLREAQAAAQSHFDQAILSVLSTPARPTGSLVGDALAAAGQSIGMSVTRVHPEQAKVGEAELARCEVTGNPVGTDTWRVGYECRCAPCRTMLNEIEPGEPSVFISRAFDPLTSHMFTPNATPPVADARRVEE